MDEKGWDAEDVDKEVGGDCGTEDDAVGPGGGEGGVVIGVEVGEEVCERGRGGVAEGVDEEASVGDEFGVGDGGGWEWWEGKGGWWEIEGLKCGEV